MSNLYQRMTETLAINMGDTLVVNHQFEEAINYIAELETALEEVREVWAGSDAHLETLYLGRLLKQTYDIAVKTLETQNE